VEVQQPRSTRRRGPELEDALLTAAWDELMQGGYGNFTIDAVADRAHTGRQVLYRRWPNRWDLVVAAVAHYAERNPVAVPDTGNLRDDLIAYLKDASQKRAEIAALFSRRMAQFFDENASSPAQLREEFMRGRPFVTDAIFERAAERGEVDLARLTPRLRGLAFDLLRAELMMTLRPVPEESIIEVVDQIVLPLVRSGAG
jgi:AcrR family transcriptional regulator